jgi:tetratricopeptide (TPR) repeat protein
MPTRESKPVEPSFQPAGSDLALKPGWWCDELCMRWDNAEADGKSGFEQGPADGAENLIHAEIEQADRIGSLNPRLAGSLNELGILYAKHHKYRQAERMFQRSLGICVAVLGSDHPDVAVILKNFGILKASQRHYAEADLLLKQSLLLTNQNLGQEHPIAAATMRTIAVFQAIQGHYGEAERFIRRSLEISERTLGTEHPEVAASRKVFAQVLRRIQRDTVPERVCAGTATVT